MYGEQHGGERIGGKDNTISDWRCHNSIVSVWTERWSDSGISDYLLIEETLLNGKSCFSAQQRSTKILSRSCSESVWKLTLVVKLEHFCFPSGHHCSFQLDCCWQYDIMSMYVEGCNLATYKQHRNKSALAVAEVYYSVSSLRRPMKIQSTMSWLWGLLTLPYI